MSSSFLFTWRHCEPAIIVCGVRWYLRYSLSYGDGEERMRERGLAVDHTTVFRWVQRYAPELDKRCRPPLRLTNEPYRVDETYIRIKKQWHHLSRAGDSQRNMLDVMRSPTRDAEAAERFLRRVLRASHASAPRVIPVDTHAAYPPAFYAVQQDGAVPETCALRQCKYLNNIVEQDHRFLKRRVHPGWGFGAFKTAQRTIQGYEAIHRLRQGQCEGSTQGDILVQNPLYVACEVLWRPITRSLL